MEEYSVLLVKQCVLLFSWEEGRGSTQFVFDPGWQLFKEQKRCLYVKANNSAVLCTDVPMQQALATSSWAAESRRIIERVRGCRSSGS